MNRQTAYWIAALFFAVLVLAQFDPRSGFTGLIRFGETWQERRHPALQGLPIATVANSGGYDGQFYAQIALDPLLRGPELEKAIDAPAYRARRMLMPAIAAVFGLGRPGWILQAYALLNVLCWFVLGWLLHRQINPRDRLALARWAGCMFSLGVLDSVRQSLVDLPALLLLVLATDAYTHARQRPSVIWLAAAGLAKETSLLGALALHCDPSLRPFPWRRAGLALFATVLPLALWSVYVQHRFADEPGSVGLGNFTWPLLGALAQAKDSLHEILLGNFDSRYTFSLAAMVGFVAQTWVIWSSPQRASPWGRIGVAYSLLLLILSPWVWSGYWAACRAVLPMTIAFNLLLRTNRTFWPLWIAGNLTMLHAVWRFL